MAKDLEEEFPVAVTLRFRSQEEREFFMGQLSDGWGESHCSLSWPWESYPMEEVRTGKPFHEQPAFGVTIPEEDLEDQRESRKRIEELARLKD